MKKLILVTVAFVISGLVQAAYLPFYITTASFPYAEDSGELAAIQAKIASTSAACAALPTVGTVYYYCDCGTGASATCPDNIGNDANDGSTPALARRTIAAAVTQFAAMAAGNTVALCKGGAFNAAATFTIPTSKCAAGSTCADLREYAVGGLTAKPVINFPTTVYGLTASGDVGGVRLLNIALKGALDNPGTFFYEGAHDITMCNVDFNSFATGLYIATQSGVASPNNITLTGSNIFNNSAFGYLGGGNNTEISYNTWEGNGSSNALDHTLYFASSVEVVNTTFVGNYIHGQYGSTCLGAPIEGHGAFDGFQFKNNYISIDAAAASDGCWGIELNNITGNQDPTYFNNLVVSGNTVINGGNTSITISSAPGLILENNVVIQTWAGADIVGISIPLSVARAQDLVGTAMVIRNNTVWFGPNSIGSNTGIFTNTEGTGHIITNNTVSSTQTSGSLNCFRHDLALTSYAFINNNHCYATGTVNFEYTQGSLASWQTYATDYGFDSASITGAPAFVNGGVDFNLDTGSPLIGAGNNTNKSALDFTGAVRPNPPAIGAYE